MKNIILCADGTGNNDVKARGTNVFKLYEAIDSNGHKSNPRLTPQVAFYDDGVGTSRFIPLRLLGGALGLGFTRNVKELYTELARAYEPGDKIYLFGFSRGAYTVRTLAGLIQCCGILNVEHFDNGELKTAVADCWRQFKAIAFTRNEANDARRSRGPTPPQPVHDKSASTESNTHTETSVHRDVKIEFLGVWDTVSAIGAPTIELRRLVNLVNPLTFAELNVGAHVRKACHAISIDDERLTFHPELWNEQDEHDDRVLQVWFPGVHSNVGGGYPKQGMSLVALDWMMAEAEARGLRFIRHDRNSAKNHYDPHDKLYDSRTSLAVYYRWQPRSIVELCAKHNIQMPKLHISVFERIANGTDGYAPGNIPYECEIVATRRDKQQQQWPADDTIQQIVSLIREGSPNGRPISPLEENQRIVQSGLASYYAFMAASVLAGATLIYTAGRGDLLSSSLVSVAFCLIALLIRRWAKHVDERLNSAYAKRWNQRRAGLRRLLRTDKVPSPSSQELAAELARSGNGAGEARQLPGASATVEERGTDDPRR